MKRTISVILALMLALTLINGALAEPFTGTPVNPYDWRELTQWPVVGEGEELEISILAKRDDTYGIDAKDMWLWNFLPAATGIKMNVEQVSDAAKTEKVNLLLASNTLPDILWGLALTTNQLVLYGQEEGLLLDCAPFATEEIMPNLRRLNDEFAPDLIPTAKTPDGGMYALPYLGPNNPGASGYITARKAWMAEAGYENGQLPETLDDFVDMLYAFKENHPESTPIGGSWNYVTPMKYILNAFGFLGDTNSLGVTVREGKAVIPAADPLYKEVLTLFNRFYKDGIISEDFFTMDSVAVKAQMSEGLNGFYGTGPTDVYDSKEYEGYSQWT
ncbi:MAG: extracellular solute-binding protein, partial [Clostridia bacterium]|nr:extracellular solute-binding protein [Clostridia bacterium]